MGRAEQDLQAPFDEAGAANPQPAVVIDIVLALIQVDQRGNHLQHAADAFALQPDQAADGAGWHDHF